MLWGGDERKSLLWISTSPGKDNCFNSGTPVFRCHQLSHPFPSRWRCFNRVPVLHWESWKGATDTCLLQEHFCPCRETSHLSDFHKVPENVNRKQTQTRSLDMYQKLLESRNCVKNRSVPSVFFFCQHISMVVEGRHRPNCIQAIALAAFVSSAESTEEKQVTTTLHS